MILQDYHNNNYHMIKGENCLCQTICIKSVQLFQKQSSVTQINEASVLEEEGEILQEEQKQNDNSLNEGLLTANDRFKEQVQQLILHGKNKILVELNQKLEQDNQTAQNLKKEMDQKRDEAQKNLNEIEEQIEQIQEKMKLAKQNEIFNYLQKLQELEISKQNNFSQYVRMEDEYQERYSFLIWNEFNIKIKKVEKNLKHVERNPKLCVDDILEKTIKNFQTKLEKLKLKMDNWVRFEKPKPYQHF